MTTSRDIAGEVVAWWRDLQPRVQDGHQLTGNRAALTRLRRAGTILELCTEPATITLCRKVSCRPETLARYALIAGVLAVVQADVPQTLARGLGEPEGNPRLSPLRFRKLIETMEPDEQLAAFRLALAKVDHRANVRDLAATLLEWNERSSADRRRQRWIYEYYQVALTQDFPFAKESAA